MEPQQPHVIVVDTDQGLAQGLAGAFGALGCRVTHKTDGEAALALAATDRPDLVVAAAELPKVTGLVVCNRLKRDARYPGLAVVLLTGDKTPEGVLEEHRGLRTKADLYLPRTAPPRAIAEQGRPLIKPRPDPAAEKPKEAPKKPAASPEPAGMSAAELQILDDTLERRREDMDWPVVAQLLEKRFKGVVDRAEKVRSLEQLLQVYELEMMNGPEAIRTGERLLLLVPDHATAVTALRRAYTRRKDTDRLAELDAHLARVRGNKPGGGGA